MKGLREKGRGEGDRGWKPIPGENRTAKARGFERKGVGKGAGNQRSVHIFLPDSGGREEDEHRPQEPILESPYLRRPRRRVYL